MLTIEYLNNKVFEANIAKFKQAKQDKLRFMLIINDLEEAHQRGTVKSLQRGEMLKQRQDEYRGICQQFDDAQGQLAADFFKIAEGIISYRRFHFVDADDAIQEFVMICFEKIDRFDPNYRGKNGQKAKAFNYMTTCILNHYRQLYRTARNYNELKRKYHDFLQVQSDQKPTPKSRAATVAKANKALYS